MVRSLTSIASVLKKNTLCSLKRLIVLLAINTFKHVLLHLYVYFFLYRLKYHPLGKNWCDNTHQHCAVLVPANTSNIDTENNRDSCSDIASPQKKGVSARLKQNCFKSLNDEQVKRIEK